MSLDYKGYGISVREEKNTHPDYTWVAYINNVAGGSEHTRGNSKDDAISRLIQRIDNYELFNQVHLAPLSQEKQNELECYIKEKALEIARVLKREGFILPNRFGKITSAAILNHYKVIENGLLFEGESITLDVATITNKNTGVIENVALYSVDHCNSPSKLQALEDAMRDK